MTGIREGWIAELKTAFVRNQNGDNLKVFRGSTLAKSLTRLWFANGPLGGHFESYSGMAGDDFRPGSIHIILRPVGGASRATISRLFQGISPSVVHV